MMPSRGLNAAARARVPQLIHSQCRNFSSAPRPHLRIASHSTHSLTRTSHPSARSIPAAIPSIAAFRYASTAQSAPAAAQTTPTPGDTTSFPNLDTITLDNIEVNSVASEIVNIPEGIGYLKQIGIDYGLGPTSAIQWILEHFHIWGGLPWWGSIAATAMIIRLVMFPLYLKSSDAMARQTAIASVTAPIQQRMAKAQKEGNTQELMLAWQQMGDIRKRAGISLKSQMLPMVAQGVLGYCGFKLMRACALLPVPGFYDGGFLWLQDLTITDGYLLLPALMAGVIHIVVRFGGETGAQSSAVMTPAIRKLMLYGMPVMVFAITSFQPGAVALWFASSGIIGIAQGQLLQRPAVRDFFGLAPLYKPKAGESTGNLMEGIFGVRKPTQPSQAGPASGTNGPSGKNTLYMHPTYQSPNLNMSKSHGRIIDTTLAKPISSQASSSTSDGEMIRPPKKGIMDSVSDTASKSWQSFKNIRNPTQKKVAEMTPEERREKYKKEAADYERKARNRGR